MTSPNPLSTEKSIAFVIPCLNEAISIAAVIQDAKKYLPQAKIYVFDNNSTDKTAAIALENGATVIPVSKQGKGYVVRAMFDKLNEDIFIMLDGDNTYSLSHVKELLDPVLKGECDMCVGARLSDYSRKAFRGLHIFGNNLVRWLINNLFDCKLTDIMSGYRVFTKEVAKKTPVLSRGFDIEIELTIQMLQLDWEIKEVNVPYGSRPQGSYSKLSTFKDGFKVLWGVFKLFRDIKPLTFFGILAIIAMIISVGLGIVVIQDYLIDFYVRKVPTAIISMGFFVISIIFTICGIILNSAAEQHNRVLAILKKN